MTTFHFIRHGETAWNVAGILQGWQDSPLTKTGEEQARVAAQISAKLGATMLVSSSSGRAKQTAQYIANTTQLAIQLEDDFREIYLGEWQGKYIQELLLRDANFKMYMHSPAKYKAQHSESFEAVATRVKNATLHLAKQHPEAVIIVVTHAVAIKSLVTAITNLQLAQFWLSNAIAGASITTIHYEAGQFTVEAVGKEPIKCD